MLIIFMLTSSMIISTIETLRANSLKDIETSNIFVFGPKSNVLKIFKNHNSTLLGLPVLEKKTEKYIKGFSIFTWVLTEIYKVGSWVQSLYPLAYEKNVTFLYF